MTLVAEKADRVISLAAGNLIAEGSAQEVFESDRVITAYLGRSERALKRSGRSDPTDMPI